MANATPTVLLVSRDPEVKLVSSTLQADGITSRTVSSMKELERAFAAAKGRCVAVLDGDLAEDATFPALDILEHLRNLPLLVLLPAEGDGTTPSDPQRSAFEE